MTRLLVIAAALIAMALGLVKLYVSQYSDGFTAGQAHERAQAHAAADALRREDARVADELVASVRAESAQARDRALRLTQEVRHARSLLVASGAGPAAGECGNGRPADDAGLRDGGAGARSAAQPAPPPQPASGAAVPPGVPDEPGVVLSADAVRLWDSALAGEPRVVGACGAADAPAGACTAATAITLEDAWANHIENAFRCGVDRANHQALIDFINQRQRAAQALPGATP